MWIWIGCALGLTTLGAVTAAPKAEHRLSAAQINSSIRGKEVGDGRHWSHQYHADGQLTRSENGRSRSGHWEVRGEQLCLLLPEVSRQEAICYEVVQTQYELQFRNSGTVVYQGTVRGTVPARSAQQHR